eukprot:8934763-Ditylum_brightwellii.AAC.1
MRSAKQQSLIKTILIVSCVSIINILFISKAQIAPVSSSTPYSDNDRFTSTRHSPTIVTKYSNGHWNNLSLDNATRSGVEEIRSTTNRH